MPTMARLSSRQAAYPGVLQSISSCVTKEDAMVSYRSSRASRDWSCHRSLTLLLLRPTIPQILITTALSLNLTSQLSSRKVSKPLGATKISYLDWPQWVVKTQLSLDLLRMAGSYRYRSTMLVHIDLSACTISSRFASQRDHRCGCVFTMFSL